MDNADDARPGMFVIRSLWTPCLYWTYHGWYEKKWYKPLVFNGAYIPNNGHDPRMYMMPDLLGEGKSWEWVRHEDA